jgi:hypothetical protein
MSLAPSTCGKPAGGTVGKSTGNVGHLAENLPHGRYASPEPMRHDGIWEPTRYRPLPSARGRAIDDESGQLANGRSPKFNGRRQPSIDGTSRMLLNRGVPQACESENTTLIVCCDLRRKWRGRKSQLTLMARPFAALTRGLPQRGKCVSC